MTIFQADTLRLAAALAAGWSLVMTVAILGAFFSRVGWGFGWRSIEDRKRTHIVSVSVAFVVLSCYAIAELYHRAGDPLTWRGPVLLVAFLLSGVGQYSMLTAQMQDRRAVPPTVPVDPVLTLIERVVLSLDRIEGRQVSGADSMARMEDAASNVADDLKSSQARADTVRNGEPGEAADAGAQSGKQDP
ncbi:MAG: hypothetical protein LC798_07085 [Chloroflexi bacterium]|nr:hypothetical protein [Chloroflexota bacterium]